MASSRPSWPRVAPAQGHPVAAPGARPSRWLGRQHAGAGGALRAGAVGGGIRQPSGRTVRLEPPASSPSSAAPRTRCSPCRRAWIDAALYARVTRLGRATTDLGFSDSTLSEVLDACRRACAHHRARLRGAHGDGGLGAPDPLRAARPHLPAVRRAVLPAGDLPRLLLRPGLLLAGAVLVRARSPTTPPTSGGPERGGRGAVRARVRQSQALLAPRLPRLRLAGGRLRRCSPSANVLRVSGLGVPIAAHRQPHVPRAARSSPSWSPSSPGGAAATARPAGS